MIMAIEDVLFRKYRLEIITLNEKILLESDIFYFHFFLIRIFF